MQNLGVTVQTNKNGLNHQKTLILSHFFMGYTENMKKLHRDIKNVLF